MEKIKGSTFAKALALFLAWISVVGICVGATSIGIRQMVPEENEKKLVEQMESNMEMSYGFHLLKEAMTTTTDGERVTEKAVWKRLENGSLEYAVEEILVKNQEGKLISDSSIVYGDESFVTGGAYDAKVGVFCMGDDVYWGEPDLFDVFREGPSQTSNHYYLALKDTKAEGSLQYVVASNKSGRVMVDDMEDMTEEDKDALEVKGQLAYYRVYLKYVEPSGSQTTNVFYNGERDNMNLVEDMAGFVVAIRQVETPVLGICVFVFVLSLLFLIAAAGHRKGQKEIVSTKADRIFYEVYVFAAVMIIGLMIGACSGMIYGIQEGIFRMEESLLVCMMAIFVATTTACFTFMTTAVRIKTKTFWRYTIFYHLLRPVHYVKEMVLEVYKKPGRQKWMVLLLWGFITFLQIIVLGCMGYGYGGIFVLFFLYKVLEFTFIVWILWQLEKVYQGAKNVAEGKYEEKIDTEKMSPFMKAHAKHINEVGQGIAIAVEEKMKSQRMKTELITNVSHDIKTPLTSIINYVDLLKKEQVENETAQEYIQVLDRQAIRLKKLIEDLMEVSKATSGNIELNMEPCDAGVMLSQVVGEYQEKFEEKGLELVIHTPETPQKVLADGKYLFRVLDNLMGNINKYGMEHTRVYVDMEAGLHRTKIIFKNISKYPLNISSEELMERFVRGDSSRSTEGNGLGLAIAKSLMERMQGDMEIDIDGDLFKVVLTIGTCTFRGNVCPQIK